MNLSLDLVESSTLALLLLLLGEVSRHYIGFLRRFAVPGPVIGGFLFALLVLALRQSGAVQISLNTTLQTPAMVAFFTTIGLGGSLASIRQGGRLLAFYLVACWSLAIMQNLVGIGVATMLGVDPMLGIMAGAVSLEGGHGAAAAFGPTAEAMGSAGATAVAIASATFGLVAGGLLGGPVASWLIDRHRVVIPSGAEAALASGGMTVGEPDIVSAGGEEGDSTGYKTLLPVAVVIGLIMVIGNTLGAWFSRTTGFSVPSYVGAMIIAVIFRNMNDAFGWIRIRDSAVSLVSNITLGFFLTMAMMSLKLWELASLALPLVIILAVQVVCIVAFAVYVVFRMLGRNYDAATMIAGFLGHGLGATPNALANMDALNSKFGVRSERAFLIVPLAGAVLIDLVALPWIVWCMNWVAR